MTKEFKEGTFYLAKIQSRWYAGTFTKQWYGWNFNAVYTAGYQYNYDGWEELYEIIDETPKSEKPTENLTKNKI